MDHHSGSPSARDRAKLVRAVLAKYGTLMIKYRPYGNGYGIIAKLMVSFVGLSQERIAYYLSAFPFPPKIYARFTNRHWTYSNGKRYPLRNSRRSAVNAYWGQRKIPLIADMIGWRCGNPKLDKSLEMYRGWLRYREAVKHYQKRSSGTGRSS